MTDKEAYSILHNGLVNAPSEHDWCMAFDMAVKSLKAWDDLFQWLDMIKPKTYPRTKGWIDCIKQIYREHMKEVEDEQTER